MSSSAYLLSGHEFTSTKSASSVLTVRLSLACGLSPPGLSSSFFFELFLRCEVISDVFLDCFGLERPSQALSAPNASLQCLHPEALSVQVGGTHLGTPFLGFTYIFCSDSLIYPDRI